MEDIKKDYYSSLYQRLRGFLRVVTVYRSAASEYWYFLLPSKNSTPIIRDKHQLRLFYRPGSGFAAVVWRPNDQQLRIPTMMEFYQAYG